ncbi:membrane protein [Streptococcus cristatus]|uniref:Inner membrane protein YhaI n=2 Tax=Streptococcus cristatus TaxID=45634 RepID=A0A512ABL5_STRCR|nr:DUF805 domain-containing protein [Streptococcus cristatus]AGK71725.1 hypothetical protein I872_08225 [Streptococcus cristatus AS 1.3089]GEN97095.1 hypothetical protein SOL01_09690 [Streptococcus cristatus]SQI48614.1 membrane protein [Streptococcus cristatus]
MINAYKNFVKGYWDFSGRSTRSEYWWIYLTNFILAVFLYMIIYSTVVSNPNSIEAIETVNSLTNFGIIWLVIFFLPALALTIRRLRDAGFHWALIFITFIPWVGSIALLVLLAFPSNNIVELDVKTDQETQ